jgi:hypothetical protein
MVRCMSEPIIGFHHSLARVQLSIMGALVDHLHDSRGDKITMVRKLVGGEGSAASASASAGACADAARLSC